MSRTHDRELELAMLETFTKDTFSPYINDTFRVFLGSIPPMDLVLISATEVGNSYGRGAGTAERTPFSILFRGPMNPILPQQIYRMEHEQMGTFELFLVPMGPKQGGMEYEAIFN
jgi:hypothetical protein